MLLQNHSRYQLGKKKQFYQNREISKIYDGKKNLSISLASNALAGYLNEISF